MTWRRLTVLIVVLVLVASFGVACKRHKSVLTETQDTGDLALLVDQGRSTNDAPDDDAGDDDADDDAADDDAGDDDAGDDDDDDDDSGSTWVEDEGGPELSGGEWDPTEISLGDEDQVSTAMFSVCSDNALVDGSSTGQIFMFNSGTDDNFLAGDIFWDGLTGFPEGPIDCGDPQDVSIGVNFAGAPIGNYCADIGGTDVEGLRSNLLTNICVEMTP